jgi:hypothetical protein
MQKVPVTVRSDDSTVPLYQTVGFAPSEACPLAVTNVCTFDYDAGTWSEDITRWRVSHRPSGYHIGKLHWPTFDEAAAVLLACDPDFPAWPLATGAEDCAATIACRMKFRMATDK